MGQGVPSPPAVVTVTGEWDAADETFPAQLLQAVAAGDGRVVVDMLNVTFIDSSAVRALILAYRAALERGGWLRLVYTHHLIRKVIDICGLEEVLPQYTSVSAASRGAHPRHQPDREATGNDVHRGATP